MLHDSEIPDQVSNYQFVSPLHHTATDYKEVTYYYLLFCILQYVSKYHGQTVSIPTSHLEGPIFKYWPGDRPA